MHPPIFELKQSTRKPSYETVFFFYTYITLNKNLLNNLPAGNTIKNIIQRRHTHSKAISCVGHVYFIFVPHHNNLHLGTKIRNQA